MPKILKHYIFLHYQMHKQYTSEITPISASLPKDTV